MQLSFSQASSHSHLPIISSLIAAGSVVSTYLERWGIMHDRGDTLDEAVRSSRAADSLTRKRGEEPK